MATHPLLSKACMMHLFNNSQRKIGYNACNMFTHAKLDDQSSYPQIHYFKLCF
uniref:Uncharacterized protein n=1 Tax=Arundo donax TaxID=35708 RepID=A0A0A9BEA9_ARUDO